ncbi:uncharacterized protein [Macrobrachium rosenbergii]|uniref:uncharacterized protein isoform X3 n=1 Tax=Macrobrachium rosenbergii TaxID=79674 RepID=UPI0034D68281
MKSDRKLSSALDYRRSDSSATSRSWEHFIMVDNPMYSRRVDLMTGNSHFITGSTAMSSSSGSGGSTKYMIRDVAPTHSRFGNVLGVERALDGRLHTQPYTIRTPTPEASRYEPNFMLSPSSAEYRTYESWYTIQAPSPKPVEKTESRYMVRPKLNCSEKKYDARYTLHPPTPELPQGFESKYGGGVGADGKETRTGSLYEPYWHIPRASLWCQNKGCAYDSQHCDDCNWKQKQEDTLSTCSSVNPPPTFTALDNYRPVRPRQKWHQCSCGIIFAITTVFSLLVLLLIAGFIIYIEMVLKYQTANVTHRM